MNFTFTFIHKQNIEKYLPELFEILHSNMSIIAPTGNTYEEDFEMWKSCIIPEIQKENRDFIFYSIVTHHTIKETNHTKFQGKK